MFDFSYHANFHNWNVSAVSKGPEQHQDVVANMAFQFSFDDGAGKVIPISEESVVELMTSIVAFFNANNPYDPITPDEVTIRQRWTREDIHNLQNLQGE